MATEIVEALREAADVASAGDKVHWGRLMHRAAREIAGLKKIANASARLCAAIDSGLMQDKQIPIASALCDVLDEIARNADAPEVCEGCGVIEARGERHHHACTDGVRVDAGDTLRTAGTDGGRNV